MALVPTISLPSFVRSESFQNCETFSAFAEMCMHENPAPQNARSGARATSFQGIIRLEICCDFLYLAQVGRVHARVCGFFYGGV